MNISEPTRRRLRGVFRRLTPLATPLRAVLDIIAWAAASWLAILLRLNLTVDDPSRRGFWQMFWIGAALQVVVGFSIGLYRRRWLYGSFDEARALAVTVTCVTVILFVVNVYVLDRPIPKSTVIMGGAFGLLGMTAVRFAWRLFIEKARRPSDNAEPILVYGAGEGGLQAITAMMRNPESPYLPVGLIDDDPAKQRLSIMGVQALGGRAEIRNAAARTGATSLLIAVPSASAQTVNELVDLAVDAGLGTKILPPVDELFVGGRVGIADIRDVSDEDLLGRHRIETDVESIAEYLTGKRVLVTGAGGSIGSELCRQIYRFGPSELMMLDRDESALHQVQLSIHGRALLDSDDTILCDIRDADVVRELFVERRPDVVFHAAALKHLPMLERFPIEGYKSNVLGSRNVLDAAARVGVDVFVNVSTDKAANPTSVLGYTKRMAERLTAHYGNTAGGQYLSVRFGNVLGSRGSVLTSFHEQIERGGPVTVTDREVSRFFMTVPEAVQLVIQAGAIGTSGEVLVLDMGEPVRIYDLARRLIARSGRDIRIVFTGLRPGEKLHEELFADGELDSRPKHRLISHARVDALVPDELPALGSNVDDLFTAGGAPERPPAGDHMGR